MYLNNDKLYLEIKDMPILKEKLKKAQKLSKELEETLSDISLYSLELEVKKEKVAEEIPPHTFH